MGGIGSGQYYRWGSKSTLEDYKCLNINRMVKLDAIEDNSLNSGYWIWSDANTGKEKSRIGYQCNTLAPDNQYLRIQYSFTDSGQEFDYKIKLSTSKPHYGGKRYWFLCPVTSKRVSKLYLIPSDGRFLSRHVYKINYASQMRGYIDRQIDKKWKILRKTDGSNHPIRPKGMHHNTFDKILDKYWEQERLCDQLIFNQMLILMSKR